MKKFMGTIAAGVLLASVAGCSSSPSEDQQPPDAQGSAAGQPAPAQ